MNEILIGIDCGTSSIKVCAFNKNGFLIRKAVKPVSIITAYRGWAEFDLETLWVAMTEALKEVCLVPGKIRAIGISTSCPTIVLMDERFRPLRFGILYLDNRATEDLDGIADAVGGADKFFHETGNRLGISTCAAANLRWVKRKEPDIWRKVAHVGFLNTFLAARLTGALGIDWTQAAYSGLYSVRRPEEGWSRALIQATDIPERILPPVKAPYLQIGEVTLSAAEETGLAPGTPVALGAADTAAASLAAGLVEANSAFETAGTSGVITFCLDQTDFDGSFMNRSHIVPDRWLAHGAMSTHGGALGWLRNKIWPELRSFAELERLAMESIPGANGVTFLPYLAGERSPIWDAKATAVWFGLRLDSSRADMVRAVFEGGAFGLKQILQRAEQHWGWRPKRLLSVGGGTRSRGWFQIKADILDVEYLPTDMPDAAALGAAMLGGIAAGVYSGLNDPALPRITTEESVVPGPADHRKAYDRAFQVYESLYPALKTVMHQIDH